MMRTVHALEGCNPEPMASYLKALGILRVVAEQLDSEARGAWRDERFELTAKVGRSDLVSFFIEKYRPTPLLAPWNGGSGFFYKWDPKKGEFKQREACEVVEAFATSTHQRFTPIRDAIMSVKRGLWERALPFTPQDKDKKALDDVLLLRDERKHVRAIAKEDRDQLRLILRATQPDEVIQWLDAAFVLQTEGDAAFPLLGSGGNDGNLDFSVNYLQQIRMLFPLEGGGAVSASTGAWLMLALFGEGGTPLVSAPIGQFAPGATGGPNGVQGGEAPTLVNPWDFVLMMEGAQLFVGSAARRFDAAAGGRATFPFTVSTTTVGGTLAEADADLSRAEMWLPLWERPMRLAELASVLAEGRAQTGRSQARTGVAFARAVAGLGVDRGISAFQRFAFLQRAGRMYLAAPLGRVRVQAQPGIRMIDELEPWMQQVRRFVGDAKQPAEARAGARRIDSSVMRYCLDGSSRRLTDVLASVGRLERVLARSSRARDTVRRPLSGDADVWLNAIENTPEVRVAAALASLQSPPIRSALTPVEPRGRGWKWTDPGPEVVWSGEELCANLSRVLERRILIAERGSNRSEASRSPWRGTFQAGMSDAVAFLEGRLDDSRIADLLFALSAFTFDKAPRLEAPACEFPPGAYALLKLLFLPKISDEEPIGKSLADLTLAHAIRHGRLSQAMEMAAVRLRLVGLVPLAVSRRGRVQAPDFLLPIDRPERLAAALLIPIRETRHLASTVLALNVTQNKEMNT